MKTKRTEKERKRTQRSFRSFKKNRKEHKDRSVLLKRTKRGAKNVPFFLKEQKRTQRTKPSFEKNGCPTLLLGRISHGEKVTTTQI